MLINSLLEAVGNVPLIELKKVSSGNVFAKAEFLNPGGSINERLAKRIMESAREAGKLKPEMIILKKEKWFLKISWISF